MKVIKFFSLLLLAFHIGLAGANTDDDIESIDIVEGRDYIEFNKPIATITGDKVEVREFFWYFCSHCYEAEPYLNAWLKTMPDTAQFVHQPTIFRDSWKNGAIFFYTLEDLGELDRLHGKLFDAIHLHKIPFIDLDDFVAWLADHGVDEKKAKTTVKSFSVRMKVNRATLATRNYPLKGVPTIVVNGKYLTDGTRAGGKVRMFKVVDYLIEKESK